MRGAGPEMSIWKQCNLAVSGSGERPNVCLMWARPGHVIALFTRKNQRGGHKKNVIEHLGLRFDAGCILPMCLLLSRFCFCPFCSFDVYLSVLVSLVGAHTESHPTLPPSSFVLVLLCLVSIRSQRVKGWGPPIPPGDNRRLRVHAGTLSTGPLGCSLHL